MAKGARRLYAVNDACRALDLPRGTPLTEARARAPELRIAEADEAGDRTGLLALARWAGRWSPHVAPRVELVDAWGARDFGLALDLTGTERLFGGEAPLVADMQARLSGLGVRARVAVAPSFGAAWALARFGRGGGRTRSAADAAQVRAQLEAAPIEALRLTSQTCAGLHALGLSQCGQLAAAAVDVAGRAGLARRFSPQLLTRLDQAFATAPEALEPLRPAAPLAVSARFLEPLTAREHLATGARMLADRLAERLAAAGVGARGLTLELVRVDGARLQVQAGASAPTRDAARLGRLLADRLDAAELDVGFGVEALRLHAFHVDPIAPVQADLAARADGPGARGADRHELADRLAARLGSGRVMRPAFLNEWAHGARAGWRPLTAATGDDERPQPDVVSPSPVWRLGEGEPAAVVADTPDGPPLLFRWRRRVHKVARAAGPDRIAPAWWRASADARDLDVFTVETVEGRRFVLARAGAYVGAPTQGAPDADTDGAPQPRGPEWRVIGAGCASGLDGVGETS